MRPLVILTSATVIILSLLIFATSALSNASAPLTPVQKFLAEQCDPHPCWRDIRPGTTSLAQAEQILHTLPVAQPDTYRVCWEKDPASCWNLTITTSTFQAPDDPIGRMTFQPPLGTFRLGDAVSKFGDPISSIMCYINTPTNGDIGPEIQRPLMIGYVSFKGGVKVVAYNPDDPLSRRMDLNMSVYWLYLQPSYDIYAPPWYGFAVQKKLGCNGG
ncbi:MAG: hypothetical protein ABI947_06285 [Chloroflexota bacterium]